MLPISRFHAVPVWSRDKNQNFRAGRQGAQSARRMEGRRLERCAGRLHQSLHLAPQILNVLFEGHAVGCGPRLVRLGSERLDLGDTVSCVAD